MTGTLAAPQLRSNPIKIGLKQAILAVIRGLIGEKWWREPGSGLPTSAYDFPERNYTYKNRCLD